MIGYELIITAYFLIPATIESITVTNKLNNFAII